MGTLAHDDQRVLDDFGRFKEQRLLKEIFGHG
jgi:hypothetical protein